MSLTRNQNSASIPCMKIDQKLLLQFAQRTLGILEADKNWSADTTDDIAFLAQQLGLADNDADGNFRDLTNIPQKRKIKWKKTNSSRLMEILRLLRWPEFFITIHQTTP